MRQRDPELEKLTQQGKAQFVPPLMLEFETLGERQKMLYWNTEGIFRLIQSTPSPKAEPFKRWLAKELGKSVVSKENYLPKNKRNKLLK